MKRLIEAVRRDMAELDEMRGEGAALLVLVHGVVFILVWLGGIAAICRLAGG